MFPAFAALLLPLAAPQVPAPPVPGTWVALDRAPLTDGAVLCTQIAFDRVGRPHVAFQDNGFPADHSSVLVHRDGGWSFLGARGAVSHGRGWYNHVAFDDAGRVLVVNRDYGAPGLAGVRVFDPALGVWVDLGSGFSPEDAHYTHLALDGAGVPHVVFTDSASEPPGRARLVRHQDGAWREVGNTHASRGPAAYTSVAFVGGEAWVAFSDTELDQRATVTRHDATSGEWTPVGGRGFTGGGLTTNVRVAVSPSGVPHVAYITHPNALHVERWNGTDWVHVGGPASAGDDALVQTENWRQWLSLVFDPAGRPLVAYQDGGDGARLTVRRFEGGQWRVLGHGGFTPGRGDYHALALDHRGVPHVSFRDGSIGAGLGVMRFVEDVTGYCAGKVSSSGGVPRIGFEGVPSDTPPDDFELTARGLPPGVTGLLVWGLAPDGKPHLGGTWCVGSPCKRTPPRGTGGAGTLAFPFGVAYRRAQGLGPGTAVFAQWWTRDPAHPDGTGAGSTGGLAFTVRP